MVLIYLVDFSPFRISVPVCYFNFTIIVDNATCIMNPNTIFSNKISMEIINVKIINLNCFIFKKFTIDFLNLKDVTFIIQNLCTNPKVCCRYKAFTFNIERMVKGCYNFLTVYSNMYKLCDLTKYKNISFHSISNHFHG